MGPGSLYVLRGRPFGSRICVGEPTHAGVSASVRITLRRSRCSGACVPVRNGQTSIGSRINDGRPRKPRCERWGCLMAPPVPEVQFRLCPNPGSLRGRKRTRKHPLSRRVAGAIRERSGRGNDDTCQLGARAINLDVKFGHPDRRASGPTANIFERLGDLIIHKTSGRSARVDRFCTRTFFLGRPTARYRYGVSLVAGDANSNCKASPISKIERTARRKSGSAWCRRFNGVVVIPRRRWDMALENVTYRMMQRGPIDRTAAPVAAENRDEIPPSYAILLTGFASQLLPAVHSRSNPEKLLPPWGRFIGGH